MKQNLTTIKTTKANDDDEPSLEPLIEAEETEDQPQVETPLIDVPQKPTMARRKKEASKPLYLKRYE